MPVDNPPGARRIHARSTANPGRKLKLLTISDLDGRTRSRQRAEELRERMISERGGTLDVMRTAHTETWAVLTAIIEDHLARYLLGDPIEPTNIATLVNARRREGEVIGEPEPRNVTPTIQDIAEQIAAEEEAG